MKRFPAVLILALATLLAAPTAEAGHPIVETARMGIEILVRSYADSWVNGRPRHIMKHFHEDAILIPHHGAAPLEGKDAMYDFWWPRGGAEFGVTSYEVIPSEIYGEGDLAYVRARFKIEYWMGEKKERRIFRNEGNWIAIITRNDQDRWGISRLMWNDPLEQVEVAQAEAGK